MHTQVRKGLNEAHRTREDEEYTLPLYVVYCLVHVEETVHILALSQLVARFSEGGLHGGYMGVAWVSTDYIIYPISPPVFRKVEWLQVT